MCGISKLISRTFESKNFRILNLNQVEITEINILKKFKEKLEKILQKILRTVTKISQIYFHIIRNELRT